MLSPSPRPKARPARNRVIILPRRDQQGKTQLSRTLHHRGGREARLTGSDAARDETRGLIFAPLLSSSPSALSPSSQPYSFSWPLLSKATQGVTHARLSLRPPRLQSIPAFTLEAHPDPKLASMPKHPPQGITHSHVHANVARCLSRRDEDGVVYAGREGENESQGARAGTREGRFVSTVDGRVRTE